MPRIIQPMADSTWTENFLASSLGERGAPCITVDNVGNFYYFHLAENIDRGNWSKIVEMAVLHGRTVQLPNLPTTDNYTTKNGDTQTLSPTAYMLLGQY